MMKPGKLYGVGIGPGDPHLLTLKAKQVLEQVDVIFVPKADKKKESIARSIISQVISTPAEMLELVFPMTKDQQILENFWALAVDQISQRVSNGQAAAFITLGDPMMYSTYIYLLQLIKKQHPEINVETIPGITSYSAAAACAELPLVEGGERLTIVPVAHHLHDLSRIISDSDTTVLMKIGRYLDETINVLEELGLLKQAVFISRVGDKDEYIETDLRKLKGSGYGYLSIIIVKPEKFGSCYGRIDI